jgi:hypothetical protein
MIRSCKAKMTTLKMGNNSSKKKKLFSKLIVYTDNLIQYKLSKHITSDNLVSLCIQYIDTDCQTNIAKCNLL